MPQQTVMWYDLVDDTIILNSPSSVLKLSNLARDPRASLCIEDAERFVTVVGHCTLVEDPAVLEGDITRLASRYQGKRRGSIRWATIVESGDPRTAIHMTIDRVLARGFSPQS